MRIFGKSASEYFGFQKVILWLIVIVGVSRLALSLAGVPNSSAKWLSITAVIVVGAVYCTMKVHMTGFGSYKHLLPLCYTGALSQMIVAASIVLAILTNRDNIFSAPEYSGGGDGRTGATLELICS
jgi:hypothetical protein